MSPTLRALLQPLADLRNFAYCLFPVARTPGSFLAEPLPPGLAAYACPGRPTLASTAWQLVSGEQFRESRYADWCERLDRPIALQRKQWEWVYILETLHQHGMLQPGRRGLVFGCGKEPLPALMAGLGVDVLATDLDLRAAAKAGWTASQEHASQLDDLDNGLCPPDAFRRHVRFRHCDMTRIPPDLRGFDFLWSSCALEHVGGLQAGTDFVLRSLDCLRPGGVAVHTTEFNLGSNERTLETPNTCIYRRRDIEALALRLLALGHGIGPINLHPGDGPPDRVVDLPPYRSPIHLRLLLRGHLTTSIGFYVVKDGGRAAASEHVVPAQGGTQASA